MQQTTALQSKAKRDSFVKRHYQPLITLTLLIADAVGVVVSFYLAYQLRLLLPLPEPARSVPAFREFLPLLALQLVSILMAFFFARMYHRQRSRYSADELTAILSGVSVGTLISIAVASLTMRSDSASSDYPRVMIVYAWLLTVVLVSLLRWAQSRLQQALQARGIGRVRVAVVGAGEPTETVLQRLHYARHAYDVVGVVLFNGYRPRSDVRVLGTLNELRNLIQRERVDEVIIAVPNASSEDLLHVIEHCDRSSISIKVLPDHFQIMAGQLTVSALGGLPLLNVRDVALRGWKLSLKRAMDLVGSAIGLVLLAPLMFLIALAIKLDSPGPALYTQERMGLDGRRFYLLKFRTMRADAEQQGPGWTVKDDPRRTRVGAFLRRTNLDELPQLINVLLGEMSLVGPRPERPVYVEEFRKRIPRYMERHRERAGITGWAQINGLRGDTSIEERTKYDLWYVENWSIWLDIRIILVTIWQSITGSGENAY
ncbi:MAG: undecaprenyl-phosphate glucose phosphotransferase [Thermoflexales bacterium]